MSAGLPSSLIHVVVVAAVADDAVVVTVFAVVVVIVSAVVVVATSCYSLINAALSATFIVERPLTACDKPSELETVCLPRTALRLSPTHPLQGNEVFLPGDLSFISDLWGVASSYKLNACLIAL